ncbi:hypothetical protein O181_080079 [Austropuccinia psidii MF-1]|uniref:Rhodanese domain-containing protein n=1 Tax=Austropuccinia psidii MF-1 TaxID=1389203 RepID=A0A9Q3FK68_9BASI|nr:hypothetical protein [Austropuccinia psidii MF-1]
MTFSSHPNQINDTNTRSIPDIIAEIQSTQEKLSQLNLELIHASNRSQNHHKNFNPQVQHLGLRDYIRYGRQMIVSDMGLPAQLKLSQASVLVIGAGGLGCPALLYLVRAGVGNISIVDHDLVEISNLHRQVLHSECTIGMNKAESAKINLLPGNSSVKIKAYPTPFTFEMITESNFQRSRGLKACLPSLAHFTLVLDCTDNPETRYLISDACAAHGIPLVSGAALRTEGHLSVWNLPSTQQNHPSIRGPCYRCIFPETNQLRIERCADEGVLGPAVGVVGVLMAWEAICLLIGNHDLKPKLLLVPSFRNVKLRNAKPDCKGCSDAGKKAFIRHVESQLPHKSESDKELIFKAMCSSGTCSLANPQNAFASNRITTRQLLSGERKLSEFRLVDVRPETQFGICSLPKSINIPIAKFLQHSQSTFQKFEQITWTKEAESRPPAWLVVCRRGIDSLPAAKALKQIVPESEEVFDLEGGLEAYAKEVDRSFPIY